MNPSRCTAEDYIQFLLATPRVATATEAARVQPDRPAAPAPDAFTRLLTRLEPDPAALWEEAGPLVRLSDGWLVLDDSTLDKPHARHMSLVCRHWSGNHYRVVDGINLISLVWTDGDRLYPTDYRLYHKAVDGKTKNDHFRDLLACAHGRGFRPRGVLFDSWYAGLDNLKAVRGYGWVFLARLTANRAVRLDRQPPRPVGELPISASGTVVWLPGFGLVKVFRIVATDGDTQHWVTNDLGMDELTRLQFAEQSWAVEEYHRGLKQYTGVDRCQCRAARAQRNHIGCAIRALVRLEWHRFTTGISWFEAKFGVVREAVRRYLEQPLYRLPKPRTA
jgi:putative transposase